MNPIIIILAILAIVLTVAFGRNPIEEGREAHRKAMEGKDPLIESIEEHNKKGRIGGMFGGGTGAPPPGVANPQSPSPQSPYPSYMINNNNPYTYNPQAPNSPQKSQPQNGYYPPPPPGTRPSGLQQSRSPNSQLNPLLQGGIRLQTGELVKFDGATMYALDDTGKATMLKDGKYPMFDGRLIVTIRNGKKIISKH